MEKWTRAFYQPVLPMGEDGRRVTASKEHIALSKDAAKEGMVLLKNQNQVLPLAKGSKVALFGKGTFDYVKGGGGSGDVYVPYIRNLYEGLSQKKESVCVFEELADFYRENVKKQYTEGAVPGMTLEPEIPVDLLQKAKAFTDTAIITICRFSGEGWDRKSVADTKNDRLSDNEEVMTAMSARLFENGDFYLTKAEEALVDTVKENFAKVIVVMNVGGMVDTTWFAKDDLIDAVLMAWQGGMEGGLAAAELLIGEGNPSGKLSDTFADKLEDYPSNDNFHESEDYVDYTDDIYVGYRYFETIPAAKEKVNYCFGFGLSYTSFELSQIRTELQGEEIQVSLNVCNVGNYFGKEVVQVYFSAPQGKLGKPARQLAAFQKTKELQPGETQRLILTFPIAQMASYDDLGKVRKSAYVLEAGSYTFHVGTSVRDTVEAEFVLELKEDRVVEQLSAKLVPTSLKERMTASGDMEALPTSEPHNPNENVLIPLTAAETEGFTPNVEFESGYCLWAKQPEERHRLIEVAEGKITMDEFLAQLSDREVAVLLGGHPNTSVANTFGYGGLTKYGIPAVMTADGPAGLRIIPDRGVYTTAWPCATLLACSWNPEIIAAVGEAGGRELKENNLAVWLTPAVNIHRSPLCGRNFEYYSEDPYLTGRLAAAMVKGIQSNRIGATVKHFALNNKETNRKNSDSRASERAIREIYLKAFEIIVKEAKPWSIMTSYNIINGQRASENRELLEGILRGEWGFDGMVTSDWWTAGEHYKETKAGNDVKMGCGYPDRLMEALEKGALTRAEMDVCAKRILELILKVD